MQHLKQLVRMVQKVGRRLGQNFVRWGRSWANNQIRSLNAYQECKLGSATPPVIPQRKNLPILNRNSSRVFFLFKMLLEVLGCPQALSMLTAPKKKNSLALAPRCCVGNRMGYNAFMTTSTALHQLFDSVGNCLSLEAASKLRELRVTDELQSQLDSWATQNSEGVLEDEERQQYEAILRALNFVAVLQAKARHIAEEFSGS